MQDAEFPSLYWKLNLSTSWYKLEAFCIMSEWCINPRQRLRTPIVECGQPSLSESVLTTSDFHGKCQLEKHSQTFIRYINSNL